MKNILFIFLIFTSVSSFAFQEKDTNLTFGVGAFGSRGLVGFSVDRLMDEHQALSVAFGVDFVGATTQLGYKYFFDQTNTSGTFWDRCFFLFECKEHPYLGAGLQYASASTIISNDGIERQYHKDDLWLPMVVGGVQSVFANNITMDIELSYRQIATGGKVTQISGPPKEDGVGSWLENSYRTVGFGIGIGYLF